MDITMLRFHLASETCHISFTRVHLYPSRMVYYLTPLSCACIGVSGATCSSMRNPIGRVQLHHPRGEHTKEGSSPSPRRRTRRPQGRRRREDGRRSTVQRTPCAQAFWTPCARPIQRVSGYLVRTGPKIPRANGTPMPTGLT